jgi:hypothetical protein
MTEDFSPLFPVSMYVLAFLYLVPAFFDWTSGRWEWSGVSGTFLALAIFMISAGLSVQFLPSEQGEGAVKILGLVFFTGFVILSWGVPFMKKLLRQWRHVAL